jgi:hypothetical protein
VYSNNERRVIAKHNNWPALRENATDYRIQFDARIQTWIFGCAIIRHCKIKRTSTRQIDSLRWSQYRYYYKQFDAALD